MDSPHNYLPTIPSSIRTNQIALIVLFVCSGIVFFILFLDSNKKH